MKQRLADFLCLAFGAGGVVFMSAQAYGAPAAAPTTPYTISSAPMAVSTPVAPNIVVTLDDSSSMRSGFTPEGRCITDGGRRFKSSYFNSQYYNPATKYIAPPNPANTNLTLTTSFTNAWNNGFAPDAARGWRDLSTNYQVAIAYEPNTNGVTTRFDQCQGGQGNTLASNPGQEYNTASTGDLRQVGVPAYYYKFESSNAGCNGTRDDDDCYTRVIVSATSGPGSSDERENFAIWYSFYRTRNLATSSSVSRAMSQSVVLGKRVAWQGLTTCTAFGPGCIDWNGDDRPSAIKSFTGTHRESFLRWAQRLQAVDSTPLRTAMSRAGDYFLTSGDNSPYGFDPNQSPVVTGKPEFSCRPNFHLLMTDGYWNDGNDESPSEFCTHPVTGAEAACGDKDNTSFSLPEPIPPITGGSITAYPNTGADTAIYRGANSGSVVTLADIALHFWATDLRPTLANNVNAYLPEDVGTQAQVAWNPKNNPATWQHMVNFTVGLGLTEALSATGIPWQGNGLSGTGYNNLLNGAQQWPQVTDAGFSGGANNVAKAYDLWHAAINSRGEAFSAETPDDLVDAFSKVLNRVSNQGGATAAVAATSSSLSTDTLVFQASFESIGWTGKIEAFSVNQATGVVNATPVWSTDGNIPAVAARKVFTYSGNAGIDFKSQTALNTAGLWTALDSNVDILNYLLGDQSKEQDAGGTCTAATCTFRKRSRLLGDIVNSEPVYAYKENFGYLGLPEGRASASRYDEYVAGKSATTTGRKPALFVGANDGMLHAFDASPTAAAGGGQELFAYVPRALLLDRLNPASATDVRSKLVALTDSGYTHKFFVDGGISVGDAFLDATREWRTVLVGTTGAGAKSVFALDVSDPDSFAASDVLWELDASSDNDLGFVIGRPVIARLKDGEWYAVFGNGYQSVNGCPVLYLVLLRDKTKFFKVNATPPSTVGAPCAGYNGLSTPTLYSSNRDVVADTVYAGDLAGNVWKFDLTALDTSVTPAILMPPKVAYGTAATPEPLFRATNGSGQQQPVTGGIEIGRAPTGQSGVMVYFGTGSYFTDEDKTNNNVQSLYGILDNGTAVPAGVRSSVLQQRTVTTNAAGDQRTVDTGDTPLYPTERGWFLDLASAGERVPGTPLLTNRVLLVTSLLPDSDDPCQGGQQGWFYALDPTTGRKVTTTAVFSGGVDAVRTGYIKLPRGLASVNDIKFYTPAQPPQLAPGKVTRLGPIPQRSSWREIEQ